MSYLGIDLGTSGLRALLIGTDGAPIASIERAYETSTPKMGWSEQDPQLWIDALDSAIADLRDTQPAFADLKGIGVAGHMHGATVLDQKGKVLRPCILWNDTRAAAEAEALDRNPLMRQKSANAVFAGFTAPKLEWLRKHEPQIYRQIDKVLLPTGFMNYYLTGEYVADMSDSAGTSWLDVEKRAWSPELLSATNMQGAQMPRLIEGCDIAGNLRPALVKKWGLGPSVVVAGGAGDNAAAACGIGVLKEGTGFLSLGTSGVILTARDHCHANPDLGVHTFCHAVPDRWYQMGVMLAATDCLNWLARITGKTPASLTAALGNALLPPNGLMFLPYLSGERTPHNDASIRGSFTGLSTRTTQEDMTRAVIEGVAFGLRDSFEALKTTGAQIDNLIAIGGGARSQYWLELIATVLGIPISRPEKGEFGAALGAARLGLVAATGQQPDQVMQAPNTCETILPNLAHKPAFDAKYKQFRAAYPAIRSITN